MPQTILGLEGWRWVVLIGSVGAAVIWWIRRQLPESPRWLEQHGRVAEAAAIVADLEKKIEADTGQPLPPPEAVSGEAERKSGSWMEIWSEAYRSRTIMLVIYNLFQTVGYYGFASWVPQLLVSQGIEVTKSLGLHFHHRHRRAHWPLGRRHFRRPVRAQMADRRGRDRHRRIRFAVRAAGNVRSASSCAAC